MSRPRRRQQRGLRVAAGVLVVLGAFLVGVGVGAGFGDGPEPSTTTYERTLTFATVTVSEP